MATQPAPTIDAGANPLIPANQTPSEKAERKESAKNRKELAAILADPETDVQDKFLAWTLTSEFDRRPKTQAKLAALLNVNVATLSRWKSSPEFARRFRESTRRYGAERITDVIERLYQEALAGNTRAMELVLKYFMGDVPEVPAPLVNINDNRLAITIGGKPAEQLRVGLIDAKIIEVKPTVSQ